MAGKNLSKRKPGHGTDQRPNKKHKSKTLTTGQRPSTHSRRGRGRGRGRDERPRGRSFRSNPSENLGSDDDENNESVEGNDLYEYEEGVAEEETRRNRRYDPVDNFEYQLPKEIEDENVRSDDDEDNEFGAGGVKSDDLGNDEDDDMERHLRMLQGITGMPSEAFEGNKKKRNAVISEPYQESEYNPSRDVLDGEGHVTVDDLVESLRGTSEYSKLRKRTKQVGKKSYTLLAPLPKEDRARLERTVAYKNSKREVTKWDPLVKRNKEAPTIIFDRDIDLGFSTVGAIASQFEPRTEFEKKMAALVSDDKVMAAHKEDGARLLELNKISIKDYKKQRDHIAKMRSLLFRHEIKMKRVKKIKSKTYRRLAKKDRSKMGSSDLLLHPEAAKEQAMKKELDRAMARMNLRHKNHSKWARRILERGLNVQDDGTRAAFAEQLNEHARLTRKMNSMGDTSSSDGSSDEDNDGDSAGSDQAETSKVLTKAKERTLQQLEEDNNAANSGLLSLPFMVRGQKKREEAAREEAMLALQEYEESLKQFDETNGAENDQSGVVKGRRVFGDPVKHVAEQKKAIKNGSDHSDSDDQPEIEAESDGDIGPIKTNGLQKDTSCKDLDSHQDLVFKSFDDIVSDPGPKTTFDVSIFASGTWKKMNGQRETDKTVEGSSKRVENVTGNKELEEIEELSDTDSEGELVDGVMSSGPEATYKLPSQEELVREAFAGDDVEQEFSKDKEEILNEENPEPEKTVLLPGWGQWTHVQKKKGMPSWMLEEHDRAKRKRDEALQNRKDARLKHVIISEKLDKKAEKLHTKTLPYPFTSKEVFERSIRMPIGPEFNPATAVGALNRPEVKKRSGVIIKPVHFEEVDPYEKSEDKECTSQKQKAKKEWR